MRSVLSTITTLIAALIFTGLTPACGGSDDGDPDPTEGEAEAESEAEGEGEAESEAEAEGEGENFATFNATFTYEGEKYELSFSNNPEGCASVTSDPCVEGGSPPLGGRFSIYAHNSEQQVRIFARTPSESSWDVGNVFMVPGKAGGVNGCLVPCWFEFGATLALLIQRTTNVGH